MAFLAGIDEAGYGPLLGPFVVGYSLLRVQRLDADLWQELEPVLARRPARKDRRLWVDDSKRVHSGPHGRSRMERTVAAFRGALPEEGLDLRSWIGRPPAGPSRWFARAPWFRRLDVELCPHADPEHARLDAALLHRALEDAGATLEGFGARAVPAAEWNHLNRTHPSKADALFAVTVEVVRHVLAVTGDAPLRLELDRHGARMHYGSRLQAALQPQSLETHAEAPGGSVYTLHFGRRAVQLRFSENADGNHFPVALASLGAKQTRERLMDLWNAWFQERLPKLRPTKGYALDAKRWIQEAEPGFEGLGVPEEIVRRFR